VLAGNDPNSSPSQRFLYLAEANQPPFGKLEQQTLSEKMKMPRDGARARRCLKKASAKRSTIKCVRHPGQMSRATNQSHNSRPRRSLATCEITWPLLFRCLRL
jgi:hypothetical protein